MSSEEDKSRRSFFRFLNGSEETGSPKKVGAPGHGKISRREILQRSASTAVQVALTPSPKEASTPVASPEEIERGKGVIDKLSHFLEVTTYPFEPLDEKTIANSVMPLIPETQEQLRKGKFSPHKLTDWILAQAKAQAEVVDMLTCFVDEDNLLYLMHQTFKIRKIAKEMPEEYGEPLLDGVNETFRRLLEDAKILPRNLPEEVKSQLVHDTFVWIEKIPKTAFSDLDNVQAIREAVTHSIVNNTLAVGIKAALYTHEAGELPELLGIEEGKQQRDLTKQMRQLSQWIAYMLVELKRENLISDSVSLWETVSSHNVHLSAKQKTMMEAEIHAYSKKADAFLKSQPKGAPKASYEDFQKHLSELDREEWVRVVHRGGTGKGNDIC